MCRFGGQRTALSMSLTFCLIWSLFFYAVYAKLLEILLSLPSILHRSFRITNVCAPYLVWIYVNLGLPSSGPPVCMANTLSTELSPLDSPLTSFIIYVISLYKSCLCIVRL